MRTFVEHKQKAHVVDVFGEHGSVDPDFALTTSNAETVAQICAKISFHSASTLKHFDVLLMVSPEGTAGPATVTGPQTFAIRASPPAAFGVYVYVIRGTWPEGSVDFFLAIELIPGVAERPTLTLSISVTKVRGMDAAVVAHVRAFNRTVAERIGALADGFLGRGRPYGESRVLWEIGLHGAEVRDLRARLGLDSGYVSRVLRSLEKEDLITVEASRGDGRVRLARLTRAGRAERAVLERRSDRLAWSFVEPLNERQRAKLVAAMTEVKRLLTASMVEIAAEDPNTPDARWCIQQYIDELSVRFEAGWDPARSIPAEPSELVPPAGLLLIARLRDKPVGCGALKFHAGAPTELKRMWVAPEARGLGLGRRLLLELERRAREAGARVVRLETNRSLKEAIHLYRSSGYREVARFNDEPYAHHWFEKTLNSGA